MTTIYPPNFMAEGDQCWRPLVYPREKRGHRYDLYLLQKKVAERASRR